MKYLFLVMVLYLLPTSTRYCTENVTEAGLVLDRSSSRRIVNVAASGFGMLNWSLLLEREEAIRRIDTCIDNTLKHNPERNRGWLYHFTDEDGVPLPNSEVSTLDTAIFWAGARKAAEQIGDARLIDKVERNIGKVDVSLCKAGEFMYHGFRWVGGERVMIPYQYSDYSECLILYRLFNIPYTPKEIKYNLPLFVYYYPLAFYDEPEMVEHLRRAVKYQRETYGYVGVTACDGPFGYQANDPHIISPLSILSASCLLPELKADLLRINFPPETPAIDLRSSWVGTDRIGIDDLVAVILANKRKP